MTVFFLLEGKNKFIPCEMCGLEILHKEVLGEAWYPEPHLAACGHPCIRGGVQPNYNSYNVHGSLYHTCGAHRSPFTVNELLQKLWEDHVVCCDDDIIARAKFIHAAQPLIEAAKQIGRDESKIE